MDINKLNNNFYRILFLNDLQCRIEFDVLIIYSIFHLTKILKLSKLNHIF